MRDKIIALIELILFYVDVKKKEREQEKLANQLSDSFNEGLAKGIEETQKKFVSIPALQLDSVEVKVAKHLIESMKDSPHSGEWKRHQVYALLIKQFPTIPKRRLGFIIEYLLNWEIQ